MALADKLRKAREGTVEAGGIRWTFRRPTDLEMVRLRGAPAEAVLQHIVDWVATDGSPVTELTLGIPGGDGHAQPFDVDAATEYLTDSASDFKLVCNAITESYLERLKAVGEAAKN